MSSPPRDTGHAPSRSRSPQAPLEWSIVENTIKAIIGRSKRYGQTMIRVQALLEVVWSACNDVARHEIADILDKTLKDIDAHVQHQGNLRDMIEKLPTPSAVLEIIEHCVSDEQWDTKLPRAVLDQVLDTFNLKGSTWNTYRKMRDAILANEHLYAGWDSVDAPKQFEIVKRLWDLHRRIYKRDTLDFKVDREPLSPQDLLRTGYLPPRHKTDGSLDWYFQLLDAAGMTESEWQKELEQKSRRQARSPSAHSAQDQSSIPDPARLSVHHTAQTISEDQVYEILNDIEGWNSANAVSTVVTHDREMLHLIWPSLAKPSRTTIHDILIKTRGCIVNKSVTVRQIVAEVPSPSNLLEAIEPLYDVQSEGSKLPKLPLAMLYQALDSVTERANRSVKFHSKLEGMANAFRAERELSEDHWPDLNSDSSSPHEPFRARSREDLGSPPRSSSRYDEHHVFASSRPVSRSPSHHRSGDNRGEEEDNDILSPFVAQARPQVLTRNQEPSSSNQQVHPETTRRRSTGISGRRYN
ncbi:hypothetical protein JCM16303_003987 [Sporobolomyces ruberrimus]